MLNKNLNIQELSIEFNRDRIIRIDNFLEDSYADALHHFYTAEMPRDWWYLSTKPNRIGHEGNLDVTKIVDNPQINSEIAFKLAVATEYFNFGEFSYSFKRTIHDHPTECECKECNLRKFITSNECIGFVREVTGIGIEVAGTLFSSLYEYGDFLSIHTDGPNGRVGFVYNLCKDWKADWGGLLNTLSKDGKKVVNTYIPGYNTLTMFDIESDEGLPHFVSHVVHKKAQRFSFTGWFI